MHPPVVSSRTHTHAHTDPRLENFILVFNAPFIRPLHETIVHFAWSQIFLFLAVAAHTPNNKSHEYLTRLGKTTQATHQTFISCGEKQRQIGTKYIRGWRDKIARPLSLCLCAMHIHLRINIRTHPIEVSFAHKPQPESHTYGYRTQLNY